jgi:hypothetical protein
MKHFRTVIMTAATGALLAVTTPSFAGASAAAFIPETPASEVNIYYNGSYLWNANPSSSAQATVIADLGVSTVTSKSVTVVFYSQGSATGIEQDTCFIVARALNSGAATYDSGLSHLVDETGFVDLPVSISGLPSGPTYAFELVCELGQILPGGAGEQIWAWY